MRNVYVVTHVQSLHHVEKRVGGWYDTSLTELGNVQAGKTGRFLGSAIGSENAELFSSDLRRAAETAEIIGRSIVSRARRSGWTRGLGR